MRRDPASTMLVLILALTPALASAQTAAPRLYVSVNGGIQTSDNTVAQSFSVQKNLENAPIKANVDEKRGTLFDAGAVVRLIGYFGMGFALSVMNHDADTTVTASIPHPFFFDRPNDPPTVPRPRPIEGTTPSQRRETAAHIQAVFLVPGPHLDVMIYGGPSLFTVRQTLVTDVTYSESFPFDTATFTAAQTTESTSKTETGFHVGGDVSWKFTKNVGIGGMVRFARAQATLNTTNSTNNNAITVDIGGLQFGGGIRLAF
jgi:opacity protein-like surface antigen